MHAGESKWGQIFVFLLYFCRRSPVSVSSETADLFFFQLQNPENLSHSNTVLWGRVQPPPPPVCKQSSYVITWAEQGCEFNDCLHGSGWPLTLCLAKNVYTSSCKTAGNATRMTSCSSLGQKYNVKVQILMEVRAGRPSPDDGMVISGMSESHHGLLQNRPSMF